MPSKFSEIIKEPRNKDVVDEFKKYCSLKPNQKANDEGIKVKKKMMLKNINYSVTDIVVEMDKLAEVEKECIKDVGCSAKLLKKLELDTLAEAGCNFSDVYTVLKKVDVENKKKTFGCSEDTC